jgi:transposase
MLYAVAAGFTGWVKSTHRSLTINQSKPFVYGKILSVKEDFTMSYIKGNRNQLTLLPPAVEDYIAKDDPVRAYDAFVEALDFRKMGLPIDENQPGANTYWPKAMLKLLVYGYAYGIRSSRKLEQACRHNLSFIWLTEAIRPDYRTIARFRIDNKHVLKEVLRQCARMCLKLDLIEGNTLFMDGTKIKANASYDSTWSEKDCLRYEDTIAKNIERILGECEDADQREKDSPSLVRLKEELADQETLRSRVRAIAKELETSRQKNHNTTDPESFVSKADRGTDMYHNAQITVDGKHGLIVNTDIIDQNNDANQLSVQTAQAQEILEKKPFTVCADSGYHSIADIEKIDSDISVVVPSQSQVAKERRPNDGTKQFSKEAFTYNETNDQYLCPKGKVLKKTGLTVLNEKRYNVYKTSVYDCKQCVNLGVCAASDSYRKILRMENEKLQAQIAALYKSDAGQRIYKLRKQKAELPFAHIKHNMGFRQLLLRGIEKAKAEVSLCAIGYNITRMISLLGAAAMQDALRCA